MFHRHIVQIFTYVEVDTMIWQPKEDEFHRPEVKLSSEGFYGRVCMLSLYF